MAGPIEGLIKFAALDAAKLRLPSKGPAVARLAMEIESVRERLPTAILKHYDHRRSRGKQGVAPVRNGTCGACHLSLPGGQLSDLRRTPVLLQVCAHCGVFILPDDPASAPVPSAPVVKPRSCKHPTQAP